MFPSIQEYSLWHDLPLDVLFRIFLYLPAKDTILNVSLVCTRWREISTDQYLWKYHCLNRWGYLHKTKIQTSNPNIPWLSYFKLNFDKNHASYLVLGAEGGGALDERLIDVKNNLKLGGLVNVEIKNIRTTTPNPETLRNYHAILFFSYHGFNQTELGNMLAEYVDMGGGVVICAFSNCARGNSLEGKWRVKRYDPLSLGSTSRRSGLKLGKIYRPDHPILRGVHSFYGGAHSSHGDGIPHPQTKIIADWTNGRPLVAELQIWSGAKIVALNMYPPSNVTTTGGWHTSSDGGLLLANALAYSASWI